jgi:predicted dehydrogenase
MRERHLTPGERNLLFKAAVIGAGYIAREHLAALRGIAGVEIAGICDLSAAMAEATAEEFSAKSWYTDHREMLSQVRPDVVHIATPPKSHVNLALDFLEAGSHVLVEKPIALRQEELDWLLGKARAQNRCLIEVYNYLFSPSVQRILALIENGEFGDVVHVDAHFCVDILGPGSKHSDPAGSAPFRGVPGGAIADFVTHLAYLAQVFVGDHVSVKSSWRNRSGNREVPFDEFHALVESERGTASLGFSSHAQPDTFSLRVHGTRMRAAASLFEPLFVVEKLYGGPRPLIPVWNGLSAARSYSNSAVAGLWRKLQGRPGTYEGLHVLLSKFYAGLALGSAPPISLTQIEAVNRLVFEILAGADTP